MPKPYFTDNGQKIQEIIRVNHAGEYGAQRIYQGQLAYIKRLKSKKLIREMLEQELEHLEYFDNQIKLGLSRPTILMPIWNIMGYAVGVFSALCGTSMSMLITENVEKVIVQHYQKQIDYLEEMDLNNELLEKIKQFKQDEDSHIHIAVDNMDKNVNCSFLLSNLIRVICKSAIFLSKKI